MGNSWYKTGKKAQDVVDVEAKRKKEEKEEREKRRVFRFWMPEDTSQEITFVDGPTHPSGFKTPFVYQEHQLKLNGHWKNWFTCLDGMEDDEGNPIECPLCTAGHTPSLVAAYTVIDHNEWTDKKRVNHKDEVKLFLAKTTIQKYLAKVAAKKKGLRGWRCEVTRDEDGFATGDRFDWDEKVELDEKIQPIDYPEVLAPRTPEQLKKILSGGGGSSDDEEYNGDFEAGTDKIDY